MLNSVRVLAGTDPVSVGSRTVTALDGSTVVPALENDDVVET